MGAGLGDTTSPGAASGAPAGTLGRGIEAGAVGDHGGGAAEPRVRWSPAAVTILVAGLAAGTVLRLLLLPTRGLEADLDLFAGWTHALATTTPLGHAYDLEFTFGPVMAYVFWAVGHLQPAFQTATDATDPLVRASLKLPASAIDIAMAVLVAWAIRDRPWVAAAAAIAIALVPVTWYVSAFWGQFESIYTIFGVAAAVAALRGRWALAGLALGLALATKPQAIPFVIPFAAFAIARGGPRSAGTAAVATVATVAILWLPFVPAGGPAAYLRTITGLQGETYAVLSLRAWNPWWIVQSSAVGEDFLADSGAGPISPRLVGYALAGAALVAVGIAMLRRPSDRSLVLGLAAAVLAAYCLLTSMHERYDFAAVVLLLFLVVERRVLVAWAVLAVAVSANYVAAIPPTGPPGSLVPLAGPVGIAGSVAITGAAMAVAWLLLREPRSVSAGGDGAIGGHVP